MATAAAFLWECAVNGAGRNVSSRVWVDPAEGLSWLGSRPYFVSRENVAELSESVVARGFRVVEVDVSPDVDDVESALLVELSAKLGFVAAGAGSWAAYSDRLWDLQMSQDELPVAVLLGGLGELVPGRLHAFARCVHNLLSLTEAVGLADDRADLQIEYFFIGDWP
jgi:hypothetical protein